MIPKTLILWDHYIFEIVKKEIRYAENSGKTIQSDKRDGNRV